MPARPRPFHPASGRWKTGGQISAPLGRVLSAIPMPTLLLAPDGRIARANDAALTLFGLQASAMIEQPLALFFADIAGFARFQSALSAPAVPLAVDLRRADGENFPATLTWSRVIGPRTLWLALWIQDRGEAAANDLHWQTAQQEIERSANAKTMFVATMSHEIRTPMNGLIGMLELLSQSGLNPEQREMVEVIQDSSRTLLSITDEILDLSKIEAGKLTLDTLPFSLRQAVEEMVDLVAGKARKKSVELAWWADPALPETYIGDALRLKQIGLNLLSNAVKFTDRGSVILRLQGFDGEGSAKMVRFEVTDTGIGLSPEQQQRLFQPFIQADHSTMRHFGGTGLGLSICHRLTALMGGEIGVVSALGAGSTFWVEIPLPVDPNQPPLGTDLKDLVILVVDDLPESRATLAAQLRSEGALVLEASDPLAAAEQLADAEHLDVALVDLPDGLPALLPDLLAKLPHAAILASLAVPDDSAVAWCAAQGLTAPLLKPLRKRQLLRAIGAALDRPAPPETPAPPEMPPQPDTQADGAVILVAEDNPINRLVLAKQLRQLGFTSDMAEHGEAAWALLQTKSYRLLLTDCIMPVLDGYELARRVRRFESQAGGHLPIVALTANVLEGEEEKCRRAGMDEYVSKPLTLDRLAALLRKIFAEPAPVAQAPGDPIDWAKLSEILGSRDPADLREVAHYFVDGFGGLLQAIRTALDHNDRTGLIRAAHSAKGAARNAAATEIGDLMAALETDARDGAALVPLEDRLVEAEAMFERLRAWLKTRVVSDQSESL